MSAAPVLELRKIEKIFGGLRAIGGVSFSVAPKQIFGLIGPNGAGKTTIFNVVTGVYRPDGGDVLFEGRSIAGWKPFRIALSGIGRTFQNIRLAGEMTVLENVMVAAHHRGRAGVLGAMLRTATYDRDEAEMRARGLELLEIFKLREAADELAGSLPYGSQRRLEIARALMLDPKLVLLDEPAAGMNSQEADELKQQIRWLRDRFDLTVVLVEHNMSVVMGVCEQVHCVDHGETIADGTPDHVKNHPAVLAAYLGEEDEPSAEGAAEAAALEATPAATADDAKKRGLALEIENLVVSYGGIKAVKGISLTVGEGEIVTLVGANGAGKSSTLKSVVRLVRGRGTIRVFGHDVENLETHRVAELGVALVPEGRAIFGNLTVRENLELGAYVKRDPARIARCLDQVVALFPRLGERMKQEGGTLSGGEQQMLAIGRAMMAEPRLLLLDEPSLGLAPKLVAEIFEAIRKIAASGPTVLLVEQNTRLALQTARRAYVLVTGEIVLSGEAQILRDDPRVRSAYLGEDVKVDGEAHP